MASNRHLGRIVALQTLYEFDFRVEFNAEVDLDKITKRNLDKFTKQIGDKQFVLDLIAGVVEKRAELDETIGPIAPEWPVEQIARIDKIILRLALFELKFTDDTPPKVAINEAVELAKSFGGENSSKFINGVLGTALTEIEGGEVKKPAKKSAKKTANKIAKKKESKPKKTDDKK